MKRITKKELFDRCGKIISAHRKALTHLAVATAVTFAFLLCLSCILTQNVSAASSATYCICTMGDATVYDDFGDLMDYVAEQMQPEQTCVIRATGTEDVVIKLASTVEIVGDIRINAMVYETNQRVIFTRAEGFTGALFHVPLGSSLTFIQSETDSGVPNPDGSVIGTANAEFVLDGGNSTDNALIDLEGKYELTQTVSVVNSTHYISISGSGSFQNEDSTRILFLVDLTDIYTDLQTAINEAESTLNFLGCTHDAENNYTGTATYSMSEGVIIPSGKELWISAMVGSGNDCFFIEPAEDFVGEALFTIENGASVAFDERQRATSGAFEAGEDQQSQFYPRAGFGGTVTEYVPGSGMGPFWCDVRGSLLIGQVIFSGGISAVVERVGGQFTVGMNDYGGQIYEQYIIYEGGGLEFFHEIAIDPGYSDLASINSVFLRTGSDLALEDYTGRKVGRTFMGWSEEPGCSYGTDYSEEPYVVTGAATLFAAWSLGEIGVEVNVSEINKTFDGAATNITITATHPLSGSCPIVYQWYKDDELLSDVTGHYCPVRNVADSGYYFCVITIQDGPYTEAGETMMIDAIVTPASVTAPRGDGATYTYNGSMQNFVVPESTDYTVSGTTGQDAGDYTAVLSLTDPLNTVWLVDNTTDDQTISWRIEKAQISKPEATTDTFTYDGTEKTYALSVGDFYTVIRNTAKNAGSYTASAILNDTENCEWDDGTVNALYYEWKIVKAQIAKPTVTGSPIYTGISQRAPVAASAYYTVSGEAVDAGAYTATVTLSDSENTEWADFTTAPVRLAWSIEPREVTKPVIHTEAFIYNGTEQSIVITANADYVIAGNRATNAGDYTLSVTLPDERNYVWDDGTTARLSAVWQIAKKTVTVSADDKTAVYGQAMPELTWSSDGFVGGFIPEIAINCLAGDNAGTYPITVAAAGNEPELENYQITYVFASYTVTKASYIMTGIALDDAFYVYDGQEHSLTLTGTLPAGVTVRMEGNAGTEVGHYTVTAIFIGDSTNYEPIAPLTATLTIRESYDPAHLDRILNGWLNIDTSWLSGQAKTLYDAMLERYQSRLYASINEEDIEATDKEFRAGLSSFAVTIEPAFSGNALLDRVFYAGDTVEGFCLRTGFFTGESALILNSYTITYRNGDSLQEGDKYFTVSFNGLTEQVMILPVLPYDSRELTFDIANTSQTYTYGDALPALSVSASRNGQMLTGRAYWHADTISAGLYAGTNSYRFCFVPDGSDSVYESYCTLTVKKAVPSVSGVTAADVSLRYGDSFPALTGFSDYPGSFVFTEGQTLAVGTHNYTYTFLPDDSANVSPVTGTLPLNTERAQLIVQMSDVVIYEGSTTVFPISYWGLVNGESSLALISRATIVDAPTAVGVYTVTPSGAVSDNYDISYRPGTLTILPDRYRAVVTDNADEGTAVFDLGDGLSLSVRNRRAEINDALWQRFSEYTATVPGLLASERIIGMYDLDIMQADGTAFTDARILQLQIPEDRQTGYAVGVIDCTDGSFALITDAAEADNILAFLTDHNGTYALCAVKQTEIAETLNTLLAENSADNLPESLFLRVKTLYDRLDKDGKAALTEHTAACITELLDTSTKQLQLKTVNKNGTKIDGLGKVSLPELNTSTVGWIVLELEQNTVKPDEAAKEAASSRGKVLLTSMSLLLDKTVYRMLDGKLVPVCETVENSAIREALRIYVPLTGEMLMYKNHQIFFEDTDGNVTEISADVEEIDGVRYLVFETEHFSTYLILADPVALTENRLARSAWIAIAILAVTAGAALLVRSIALRRTKKEKSDRA